MHEPISVCVLAHNEANSIEGTLDSILNQTSDAEMQIIVAANGCTDDTEDVVLRKASEYPNIQLLSIPKKSHVNAWNEARAAADHNYIFFADGDVYIEERSFERMLDEINQGPGIIAVGAWRSPVTHDLDKISSMLAPVPGPPGGIRCFYLVDNNSLTERLREFGYEKIPEDVLAGDDWLTLLIGNGNWIDLPDAKVHFRPPHWSEVYEREKRIARSLRVLKANYPELFFHQGETQAQTLRRLVRQSFTHSDSYIEGVGNIVGYATRYGVRVLASQIVRRNTEGDNWTVIKSTKKPIYPTNLT